MADPNPTVDVLPDEPVTFRIVEKGSQRGGDLLVDSDGYSYNYKTTETSTATGNVLKRIKRRLPTVILLQRAVADFEAGLWKAMAKVFPGVTMGGCVFHFEQALFRHVQQLGMERAYRANNPTRTFLKKVFALDPNVTPALDDFMKYVSDTWMESTVWPVANWCVYSKSIRTNNDVEGWHARLNRRATRGNLEFYLLLRLLKEESDLVNIQMRLVCEKKLKRNQRKKTRERQGQIFAIWDAYRENRSTASQLLREIGLLIGP